MLKLILALILSLAGVLVLGPRVIPVLRKLKFGQTVCRGRQNRCSFG